MDIIPWRRKTTLESREGADSPLAEFRREMDDVLDRLWHGPIGEFWPFERSGEDLAPAALDVTETDDEVIVKADMPGIDAKRLDINVEGDRMTLRGHREQEQRDERKNYVRMERRYAGFHRTFPLPSTVDADKASAEYKDGVLTIRLPRREDARPKKIEVKT